MDKLDNHPTVKGWREKSAIKPPTSTAKLNRDSLRSLCLEMGADDVGFVEIGRDAIADHRPDILKAFPVIKSLISIVCRMNRENILALVEGLKQKSTN